HVPVEPEVMEEVVSLEDAVVLDDPVVLPGHERLEDDGRELGVIEGGQGVADVVHERAGHILVVAAVAVRPRRGLQAVRQPVDRVATGIPGEQGQVTEHAVGQPLHEAERVAGGQGVDPPRGVRPLGEPGSGFAILSPATLIPDPDRYGDTLRQGLSWAPRCSRLTAVQIGLSAIGIGPGARAATLRAVATTADAAGFATLWMGEHAARGPAARSGTVRDR